MNIFKEELEALDYYLNSAYLLTDAKKVYDVSRMKSKIIMALQIIKEIRLRENEQSKTS